MTGPLRTGLLRTGLVGTSQVGTVQLSNGQVRTCQVKMHLRMEFDSGVSPTCSYFLFQVLTNCEQVMNKALARHLISMR